MQLNLGLDFDDLKGSALDEINRLVSDKITAKYPVGKQNTLLNRRIELAAVAVEAMTADELLEFRRIEAINAWIRSLLALSNDYYALVSAACNAKAVYDFICEYRVKLLELGGPILP